MQGQGTASLVGFGATPQLFRGRLFQRNSQPRRRQRSVPASNFARPQTRPPSCSTSLLHIVAPNGRDRVAGLSDIAALFRNAGISLLREREVTGRDASLPAPLLSALGILVARETIGALPQTPPEALPLDSARGNFPLDPFRAIELVAFPYFFRVLIRLFCFLLHVFPCGGKHQLHAIELIYLTRAGVKVHRADIRLRILLP